MMTKLLVDPTLSKANSLIKRGRFADARELYENLLNNFPNDIRVINALESLNELQTKTLNYYPPKELVRELVNHYNNGNLSFVYKKTLTLSKSYPHADIVWEILSSAALKMGKLDEAVNGLQKLIAIKPNQAKPYFHMGNILKDKRKLSEALYFYKKAFLLNPNFIEACNNIGVILKDQNQLDEALIYYKKALSLNPSNAEIYNNIGVILRELNQVNESLNFYEKALSLNFNLPSLHNNMGGALKSLGRFQDAMASYKKAIELKPDYVSAHRNLTTIKKYHHKDDQFNQMLDLYHNKNISEDKRCQINFALAKAFEDLENFEKAFTHYKEGNKIRKRLLNYNIHDDYVLFEKIKKNYKKIEKKLLKVNNCKNKINPIFIIGMPRSGTTLVEQIISSHSKVTGAGELMDVSKLGANIAIGLTDFSNKSLQNFRYKYLEKLNNISNGNLFVTDKMPHNFRYIGLICAAFPDSKIIHVKRNPAAVCWANYKQYFSSKNFGYSYDIHDVVKYYKLYENIMKFWSYKLSNRILDFDYENLTANQEAETKKLINFLDLYWDEKCLSPENNDRSVGTISNFQIRQKIYKGSSEKWQIYQPFLDGAFDSLFHN